MTDGVNPDLPGGWTQTTLGALLREPLRNGHSARRSDSGRGVRTLTLTAVTYGDFSEANTKLTVADPDKVRDLWLEPGDLLVERSNTPELVGTARLYKGPRGFAIFPDLLIRARFRTGVLPEFAELQLHSERARDFFTQNAQGTAGSMPKIDQGLILRFPFVLPPVSEQKRIVDRIGALHAQAIAARERLTRVRDLLKRFRLSVLAAACSGRLTEEWRRQHHGPRPTNVSHSGVQPDMEGLPELPEVPLTWEMVRLEAVTRNLQYGASVKASDDSAGVPILRMGNIQDGSLDLRDLKYVRQDEASKLHGFLVESGDLLFNRTNSPELVGKTAVVSENHLMLFASYLIRIQARLDFVLPEYLSFWLNSPWGRSWARVVRTDGVSQSNINASNLRRMPLPLPTLTEQQEVVRRVFHLFALAATLEAQLTTCDLRVGKLLQTILARAFRGELLEVALA